MVCAWYHRSRRPYPADAILRNGLGRYEEALAAALRAKDWGLRHAGRRYLAWWCAGGGEKPVSAIERYSSEYRCPRGIVLSIGRPDDIAKALGMPDQGRTA